MSKIFIECTDLGTGGFSKTKFKKIIFAIPKNINWVLVCDILYRQSTQHSLLNFTDFKIYSPDIAKKLAIYLFDDRFGFDPNSTACDCCGTDFKIEIKDKFEVSYNSLLISYNSKDICNILLKYFAVKEKNGITEIKIIKNYNSFYFYDDDYDRRDLLHKDLEESYQLKKEFILADDEIEFIVN